MIKAIYHPIVPVLQIICTLAFITMMATGFIEDDDLCTGSFIVTVGALVVSGGLLCIFGGEVAIATTEKADE